MKETTNLSEFVDVLIAVSEKKTAYRMELFWDGHMFHWSIKVPGINAEDFRTVTGPRNKETNRGVTK